MIEVKMNKTAQKKQDQKLRVAIIGLGWWGKIIAKNLHQNRKIKVIKVVDIDKTNGLEFANKHGCDFTTSYPDILKDSTIDAVLLTTPHSMHEQQIVLAAEAQKHVFCEKPFCLNRRSALRAMEAIENAGVQVGVGHERRFEPPIIDSFALAKNGKLGSLMHIEANFSHDIFAALDKNNWRFSDKESPAGGLTATLIHLLDLSICLFGQPDRVIASLECHGEIVKNGDTLTTQIKFENGCTATLNALTHTPFFSRFCIFGSHGWIEIRDKTHVEAPEGWVVTSQFTGKKQKTMEYPVAAPLVSNLECFADAIRGTQIYPNTPDQIIMNVSLMEAVAESAKTEKVIFVER